MAFNSYPHCRKSKLFDRPSFFLEDSPGRTCIAKTAVPGTVLHVIVSSTDKDHIRVSGRQGKSSPQHWIMLMSWNDIIARDGQGVDELGDESFVCPPSKER